VKREVKKKINPYIFSLTKVKDSNKDYSLIQKIKQLKFKMTINQSQSGRFFYFYFFYGNIMPMD